MTDMAVAEYLVANRKDAGMPGPQGPAGPAGVTSARGETLPPGSEVEVVLENRVLTVKVPRGDKGEPGDAATVTVGDVTTGEPGSDAAVSNSGDEHHAVLDFTLPRGVKGPKGDTATVKVGSVATGEPGSQADVANKGDEHDAVLDFTIPQGVKGDAATVQVGKVATGEPGTDAVVGNSGDEHAAILDFTIPKGQKGDRGDGLQIDYTAASSGELPTSGVTGGQTGIVNGELFVWDGSQWSSQGQMQGAKGDPGVTPDITLTASVDANVGTPSVDVIKSGTPENPTFDIALHNLKGGVNTVAHDDTLTGDGTTNTPLGVSNGTALQPINYRAGDLDTLETNGFYKITGVTANTPNGEVDANGIILVQQSGVDRLQLFITSWLNSPINALFLRRGVKNPTLVWNDWIQMAKLSDIPADYVSDSELASRLAGYVTDGDLTQGLQTESSEREKQDNLLEEAINGKIAASNVKAGDGIGVSVSGNDATVSLNARTIPVTFEASLFKSGLAARKSVTGLGSVNMISPAADAANVSVIQAAGPVLAQDHGDDSSIPEGMVQLTVTAAPTADMDFVITVLRSEA